MKNKKKYLIEVAVVALFALISVAYFWQPISAGKVLSGHDHTGAVGSGVEMNEYREKHNGERTRWTNTLFSGMPTYQMAPSYESTDCISVIKQWYTLYLPTVASYVFIMLLGFYIMLRCFDFKVWMSALGAILWAFSSYYFIIIAAGHIWKLYTLAFIPPTIGGMALCYKGKYSWGVVVTGLFMALQIVSNHVQMTYYFLLPIFALSIGWLISDLKEKKSVTHWLKGSFAFAFGCLLGIAINISNLYHTWEYSKESMRGKSELTHKTKDPADQTSSGLERSYITAWSYGIGETWTLLVPNTKGGASMPLSMSESAMSKAESQFRPIYQQMGQYWGEQPGTSGPVYIGAFVCMLFVLCLLIVRGPVCWALLIATMLSIALSWGKNFMGLTDFFLDYVPMYDKFRTVASILVIAEFTMPLMALMALKKFIEEPDSVQVTLPFAKRKVNALWLSFVITGGICFLFWLVPDVFFGNYISSSEANAILSLGQSGVGQDTINALLGNLTEMRRHVFSLDAIRSFWVIAIGTALMALYYYKKLKAVPTILLILLVCLVDMWSVNKRYLNDGMFVYPRPVEKTFQRTHADDMILLDPELYYRTLDLTVSTFNSNDASYWHKSIGGYHAAKLRRYQEVIEAHIAPEMSRLQSAIVRNGGDLSSVNADSLYPVLNMLNMKYILMKNNKEEKVPVFNPSAMGNGWFAQSIKWVDNADDELAAIGQENLRSVAVVDTKFKETLGVEQPTPSINGKVKLVGYEANQLRYEIESKDGGVVVFSDIYYPGWTATVSGEATPVVRANYILRAIKVPAGKHEVVMTFDPQTVHTTEAIAYGALILLALITLAKIITFIISKKKCQK